MTARDLQTLLAHAAGADARSDAELLADAANPAALTALVRRHGPLVWGTARRMLPDPADAADAFQAVFLALTKSYRRIRTPAAVGGWLHAATVRVCLKQRRQLARRRLREMRVARPVAVVPVADAAWDAILAAVHEEIHRLPDGERTAFVVCELQGVPQPEAARRLGWKPGTLTGRLSKARAKLLTSLSARGFAPAAGLAGVGTLVVPAEVLALAEPAASVSPAVAALSTEVTAMLTTKHLAAAVLLTAGLLAGVGGGLVAQDAGGGQPPKDAPTGLRIRVPELGPTPVEFDFAVPLEHGQPIPSPVAVLPATMHARWEYDYQIQPPKQADFVSVVNNRGQAGWELAAVVQVSTGTPMVGRGGMGGESGGMGVAGGGLPGMAGGGGGQPGMMGGGGGDMAGRMGMGQGGRASGGEQVVNLMVFKRPAGGMTPAPSGGRPAGPPPGAGMARPQDATEVIKLRNVAAEHVSSAIRKHKGIGDRLTAVAYEPASNTLSLAGPADAIQAARLFIQQLDVKASTERYERKLSNTVGGFQAVALKHARATEVAKLVQELFANHRDTVNRPKLVASADERRNLLLFSAGDKQLEQEVRALVTELDVPAAGNPAK